MENRRVVVKAEWGRRGWTGSLGFVDAKNNTEHMDKQGGPAGENRELYPITWDKAHRREWKRMRGEEGVCCRGHVAAPLTLTECCWNWQNAVHQLYLHILFSKRDDGRIYLATSLNPPRSFRLLFIKFSDPISSDALLQCLFSLTFRKLDAYSCQLKDMRLWRHISPDAKLIFWRVVGLYEFCK